MYFTVYLNVFHCIFIRISLYIYTYFAVYLHVFHWIFTSVIAPSFCRKVDHFTLCCQAENNNPNVICEPLVGNGVSSCDELLKNKVLTYCIWVLGVMAFVGNFVVILWRVIGKDISRVNSFLLVGNRCKSNTNSLIACKFCYLLKVAPWNFITAHKFLVWRKIN